MIRRACPKCGRRYDFRESTDKLRDVGPVAFLTRGAAAASTARCPDDGTPLTEITSATLPPPKEETHKCRACGSLRYKDRVGVVGIFGIVLGLGFGLAGLLARLLEYGIIRNGFRLSTSLLLPSFLLAVVGIGALFAALLMKVADPWTCSSCGRPNQRFQR